MFSIQGTLFVKILTEEKKLFLYLIYMYVCSSYDWKKKKKKERLMWTSM